MAFVLEENQLVFALIAHVVVVGNQARILILSVLVILMVAIERYHLRLDYRHFGKDS